MNFAFWMIKQSQVWNMLDGEISAVLISGPLLLLPSTALWLVKSAVFLVKTPDWFFIMCFLCEIAMYLC